MARWLCRLDPAELNQGQKLAEKAQRLGVGGWLLRVGLDGRGRLGPEEPLAELLAGASGEMRFCLQCHLVEPLSPQGELRAAAALVPFLAHPRAVRLGERPLLVLEDPEQLSHPLHAPARLRLALRQGLQKRGAAADPLLLQLSTGQATWLDGTVEVLEENDEPEEARSYPRWLYRAHYRPLPKQLLIPAVRPPLPEEESGMAEADKQLYQEWLELASAWSAVWHNGHAEAPVLIKSWEAHQLWWKGEEPEISPSLAAAETAAPEAPLEQTWGNPDPAHLALLIHGFYLDRLEKMLERLPAGGEGGGIPPLDIYVSTPAPRLEAAAALLNRLGWPRVRLFGVANRGRDIAPFLRHLLPAAVRCGHEAFVKLHTKASPHLAEDWGAHLVDSLLAPELLGSLRDRLQQNPALGLLAPSGTLLPTTVALNHNAEYLVPLLQQRGMEGSWFLGRRFVAGSMMAGRLQALSALLQRPYPLEEFAPEAGQTDGTLAHALERWISALVLAEGWQVEELHGPAHAVPGFGYRWVVG